MQRPHIVDLPSTLQTSQLLSDSQPSQQDHQITLPASPTVTLPTLRSADLRIDHPFI